MRDFHLILFVLALVIIDVTFITIWVYYDPLEMKEIIFDELVRIKCLSLHFVYIVYLKTTRDSVNQALVSSLKSTPSKPRIYLCKIPTVITETLIM